MVETSFVLKDIDLDCFPLFQVGGQVAGKGEVIANSAQLELELGLTLAKYWSNITRVGSGVRLACTNWSVKHAE